MKNRIVVIIIVIMVSLIFTNCATIIKGYEDRVVLANAPDSIKVFTNEGIEIPVISRTNLVETYKGSYTYRDVTVKEIRLRNNKEYVLHLKYYDKEKIVSLYPKIGFGWAILDFVCGILPSFYDAYTGSWNRFPEIDSQF